jgi:hypothetical protein
MPIPPKIRQLSHQINQELEKIEQDATEGLNITKLYLSQFPDNTLLLQFFATFSNMLLFVEIYRRRVQTTLEQLDIANIPLEIIQETGEDLGMILGQVLEARINVKTLKNRLKY